MMDFLFPRAEPQVLADATERPRPWYHWRRWSFNFLTFSILAHVFFGVLAAYLIVATIQTKQKPVFKAPGPQGPSAAIRSMEHKVQMAKKQNTMSAPVAIKRVTTIGPSKTTLPAIPAMPKTDSAPLPATMGGMGGTATGLGGFGAPAGGGSGGSSRGGALSLFGVRKQTGGSFVGRLYDLKQDRARRPTNVDNDRYANVLKQFVTGGFNTGMLASYYQASVPLYATQMFTPSMSADEAPKAFGVEAEVQPRLWLTVYTGKVIPPESGTFKFVGFGDDVLVVRFNGKIVLDAGYLKPSGYRPGIVHHYDFQSGNWYADPTHGGGHGEGMSFVVEAGKSYDMQILIGEQPGGSSIFQLLLMKQGVSYREDASHNPIFPVFRLAGGGLPTPNGKLPPFDPGGPIWKAEMPSLVPLPRAQ